MLNIYYSKTISGCVDSMLNKLKNSRTNTKQVVFTPDRMTLQVEQLIFEHLNESCFFDINVTTLTRFTNSVISNNNSNHRLLNKPACVALVKKILLENKREFKTIKKAASFDGFAATLFQTISMFKSCGVPFDKINDNTKNNNLNFKIQDIKLVYQKYEEFLQEDYTDSFNKLNLLVTLIKDAQLKDTNFYFIGFNDFTPQMYDVISQLIKHSKEVSIACAVGYIDGLNNKNIFLNNVYLNLIDLCEVNGYNYKKIYCKQNLSLTFEELSNNIFALNPKPSKVQSENISLYCFNNILDEATFAIKKIQNLVSAGKFAYDDFVIITSDIELYKKQLEPLLNASNVPYFFDVNQPLLDILILRFYTDLFDLIKGNFNKRDLFNFLRSYTLINQNTLDEFESVVIKSGYNYRKILEPILHLHTNEIDEVYTMLSVLQDLLSHLKDANTISDYIDVLIEFTETFGFNEYINSLSIKHKQNNNVLEFNKLQSAGVKLVKGFNEIKQVFGNYQTNTLECFSIIRAYFENLNIVMPPILANSVLITDVLEGELSNKKYAIMLGAGDGAFPTVQSDLGLITDRDIALLESNFKLSPTINFLNKRNKFKVYETMLNFENIFLSYISIKAGEKASPSEVIENILSIFTNLQLINGSLIQHNYQNEYANHYFLFNNINPEFASVNFIKNLKLQQNDGSIITKQNTANLCKALQDYNLNAIELVENLNYKNTVDNIVVTDKKETISVSEVEKFYRCPFAYFVDYVLQPVTEEDTQLNARQIGSILHEYVEKIMHYVLDNKSVLEINSLGERVLTEILQLKYKSLYLNPSNANSIKSLYTEIERINVALIRLNKASGLQSVIKEKYFTHNFDEADVVITGIVDRVDANDDKFIVIDYKTGGDKFNDFTDIASGKKLQLIIYAHVISKKWNKKPIGAFYLPLVNEYSKDEEELYKLIGVVVEDFSDVLLIDKNLEGLNYTSDVVNLQRSKGKLKGKLLITENQFGLLQQHALNMVKDAYEQICVGVIEPTPLKIDKKTECTYCNYKGLCKFNVEHENKYREVNKNVKITDLENSLC